MHNKTENLFGKLDDDNFIKKIHSKVEKDHGRLRCVTIALMLIAIVTILWSLITMFLTFKFTSIHYDIE